MDLKQLLLLLCLSGLAACVAPGPIAKTARPADPTAKTAAPGTVSPNLASEPQLLVDLSGRDILRQLGDPSFLKREGPAEIWQYYGQGCILDLFLYNEKDRLQVSHVEIRGQALINAGDASCLGKLLESHRSKN